MGFTKMKMNLFLIILSFGLVNCSKTREATMLEKEKELNAIKAVLDTQSECWTAGNIDCFMQSYWKSDSLRFIGQSGISYGWDITMNNYKKNYTSKEEMGSLTFDIVDMSLLGPSSCFVIGKYHLSRTVGDLDGHFTLLWEKIEGQWVIVADHSS